jgi:EAL domain-containing protein (putative c-di-GMP-specific phosphodiesterase class I)
LALERLAFLREVNCDEMQGYLFSPALPVEEMSPLLKIASEEVRSLGEK